MRTLEEIERAKHHLAEVATQASANGDDGTALVADAILRVLEWVSGQDASFRQMLDNCDAIERARNRAKAK